MRNLGGWPFLLTLCSMLISLSTAISGDTITPSDSLRDGHNLSSIGGTFELGFFSPGTSKNRYLGIWFKNIPVQTVVWVANREKPIRDTTGVLRIGDNGTLVLLDQASRIFWSSEPSGVNKPVVQLLDSGNLVVRDANSKNPAWQSFDCPDRTLLAGMKLSTRTKTGPCFKSWKNKDDPSPGDYLRKMEPHGDVYLWHGSKLVYRTGPWNGLRFSGIPDMRTTELFTFDFESNENETYYKYEIKNRSILTVLVLEDDLLQRLIWINHTNSWKEFWSGPKDKCDNYGSCGPYGVCNINNSPLCSCLKGFQPKTAQEWDLRDGSDGCKRKRELNCSGDIFFKRQGMKLPDMSASIVNKSMSPDECKDMCLRNCSCTAYANADIRGDGSGCIIWVGDLVDLKEYVDGGQNLYIRLAASELDSMNGGSHGKKKGVIVMVVVPLAVGILLLMLTGYTWRKKRKRGTIEAYCLNESGEEDLALIDFGAIATATDDFSMANKLGEGGFGSVYKGKLKDGREVAVKRLCKNSVLGVDEFKNEVRLTVKLQHRNLVQFLGCCIEGEERILVYEYMPNKSLDAFIFGRQKGTLLDWQTRHKIVLGIARGLLYLHQDSRLRIIHRDLKAANVLLDLDMNPKISDFGTARIFGGEEMEENTRRVVGTYGYMSPEYAMGGIFSVKSDVYSFGVLLLEIVSGKKNRGVYHSDMHLNLLEHAWKLWKEGNCLELLDESVGNSYQVSEVRRCIQIGLLCVQEHAEDRPTMPSVVLMLGSNSVGLPPPKKPGFVAARIPMDVDGSTSGKDTGCDLTITELECR